MRGNDANDGIVFSYVSMERRIASDHPLRKVRDIVDEVLKNLSKDFAKLYSNNGRPSVPPVQILRALLLQILYSIRSERQLVPRQGNA
jgi:transposase